MSPIEELTLQFAFPLDDLLSGNKSKTDNSPLQWYNS